LPIKTVYTLGAALSIFFASSLVWADKAYEFAGALTLESVANVQGGVERGSRQLANLDLTWTIDTAAANWWGGGQFFIYLLGDAGGDPAEMTGDIQEISNIAAENSFKIYEFWYEHKFAQDHLQVLIGLHDFNSRFYSLDSAGLFNHASFGIGPDTSQAGPSIFPTTAFSLQLRFSGEVQYLQLGVYDGVPGDPDNPKGTHIHFGAEDGVFTALEAGVALEGDYKLGLGGWWHTARFESPVTGANEDNNHGVYLVAEKYWDESLATFIQIGQADKQVNQLEDYLGAGLVLNNLAREADSLGLAVAYVRNGEPFLRTNADLLRGETAWELSYLLPWLEHLSVQASLYYIHHPAMNKTLDDALALGARAYVEF